MSVGENDRRPGKGIMVGVKCPPSSSPITKTQKYRKLAFLPDAQYHPFHCRPITSQCTARYASYISYVVPANSEALPFTYNYCMQYPRTRATRFPLNITYWTSSFEGAWTDEGCRLRQKKPWRWLEVAAEEVATATTNITRDHRTK